jgi:hypothetical protein
LTQETVNIRAYSLGGAASGIFVARVSVHPLSQLVGHFSFVGPAIFISHFLDRLQVCGKIVIKLRYLLRLSNTTQLSTFDPHTEVGFSAGSIT